MILPEAESNGPGAAIPIDANSVEGSSNDLPKSIRPPQDMRRAVLDLAQCISAAEHTQVMVKKCSTALCASKVDSQMRLHKPLTKAKSR